MQQDNDSSWVVDLFVWIARILLWIFAFWFFCWAVTC